MGTTIRPSCRRGSTSLVAKRAFAPSSAIVPRRSRCLGRNKRDSTRWTTADVAVTIDDRARTPRLRTGCHENPVSRFIDISPW